MKFFTFLFLLPVVSTFLINCNTSNLEEKVWYVSPEGNDDAAGTLEAPLRTLARGVALSREWSGVKKIILKEGMYYDTAIKLSRMDNNLSIQADEGAQVHLSGGRVFTDWKKEGKLLYVDVPGTRDRSWDFRMIEINGSWRTRARLPESGALMHRNVFDVKWLSSYAGGWERKPTEEERNTLKYKRGDITENIDVQNAELTIYHEWDESLVGLKTHY